MNGDAVLWQLAAGVEQMWLDGREPEVRLSMLIGGALVVGRLLGVREFQDQGGEALGQVVSEAAEGMADAAIEPPAPPIGEAAEPTEPERFLHVAIEQWLSGGVCRVFTPPQAARLALCRVDGWFLGVPSD